MKEPGMESNLRPLTLSELLDRTAQLYREHFLLFAGIFSVYAGVVMVLNLFQIGVTSWLGGQHANVWIQVLIGFAGLLKALLVFLFAGAAIAAINRAVAWVHLGEPATIRKAYLTTLPRLPRYLWLMTIIFLMIWAPLLAVFVLFGVAAAFIPGFSGGLHNPANQPSAMAVAIGVFAILLLVPYLVYAILMALRYSLAVPASVVENLNARTAIRRSIELSKGSRGRIFMLGLLVFVIEMGLVLFSQFFVFVIAYKHKGQVGPVAQAISQVISFFTNSFIGPIYATGLTLFYYDQRVRKEGYDIEWMMQAAGLTVPETPPTEDPAPPPAAEQA
jgi:hypothetical protein